MWLHCIQEDGRTSLACVDKEPLNSGSSREGLPLRDEVIWGLITALWAILTEACEHSWRFAELKKKSVTNILLSDGAGVCIRNEGISTDLKAVILGIFVMIPNKATRSSWTSPN